MSKSKGIILDDNWEYDSEKSVEENKKSWEEWCKRKGLDPQSDNFAADIEEVKKKYGKMIEKDINDMLNGN
jgi:hypothetical protein